jgi:hypothetical protein
MNGLGAPTRRGAAVLRLEGQHTGRSRSPATRLDVTGPSHESIQGGREGEDGRGVLTSARWCSRGRLGVVVHVGVVDVPGGGIPSALVPWSRTALAPTARRLLSWRSRLCPTSGPRSSRRGAAEARPLLPLLLPLSSLLGCGTEDWEKPQVVGGEPTGVRPQGEGTGQGGRRAK